MCACQSVCQLGAVWLMSVQHVMLLLRTFVRLYLIAVTLIVGITVVGTEHVLVTAAVGALSPILSMVNLLFW